MSQSIHGLEVDSREHLERLEEALELAGIPTSRDDDNGLLSFSLNDVDVVEFQLDDAVLQDEQDDARALEDAEQVADYYWRQ